MTGFTISYRRYFSRKARRALIRAAELPGSARKHYMFVSHNDAIGSQIQAAGAYEWEVLEAIELLAREHQLSDGAALDIGANIGNHALRLSGVFKRVLAFEPSPWATLVLRANLLRNRIENVDVFRCALGEHAAEHKLIELAQEHTGMIQLLPVSDSAASSIDEAVPVRRGDDILEAAGQADLPIHFIKIDVEGMEVPALKGLCRTIERFKPVIAFESRNLSEGAAVIAHLRASGYSHFHTLKVSRFSLSAPPSLSDLIRFRKRYDVAPLLSLENRHYSAVFAWNRPL